MSSLPSYEEAVSGGHWLDLAAPYVSVRCYSKLCRVSRRFSLQFAPRLWNDPLQAARNLGLHPNDDLKWLVYFITRHAKVVRLGTRTLVTSLDLSAFAVDAPALVAGASGQNLTDVLRQAAVLFPAVRCILIGGKSSYDPADLGRLLRPDAYPEDGSVPMPLILDISRCGLPLPNNFFHLAYWRQLVFLDMSDLPGSLKGLVKTGTFFSRGALPSLRILKLRGRGLNEESLAPIAEFAQGRLWSLDLCQNKLTDACIHTLLVPCFGADDLTADSSRAEVQGRLVHAKDGSGAELPPVWRGWLTYIDESLPSGAFSHPDRYLADAPVYDTGRQSRLAGYERLLSDSAQDIKVSLAGGLSRPIPDWHDARGSDICKSPPSLTHLHLSDNPRLTIEGVEAVFRRSRGHIRHFDCASPPLLVADDALLSTSRHDVRLAGVLGRSHLFRPVFASNLQSLRVHHSLVTRVPAWLGADPDRHRSRCPLSALQYAETVLRERAELAYPLTFVPDANPRLQSLTLARLPRVSVGPLIDSLIRLLISAADQEAAIWHAAASRFRRSPTLLRGLRHIRLEFDPWPRRNDDHDAALALDALDAGGLLLDSGADDFSFFKEAESAAPARRQPDARRDPAKDVPALPLPLPHRPHPSADATRSNTAEHASQSDRLSHYPLPGALRADSEHVRDIVSLEDAGERHSHNVTVWVGSGYPGRHAPAVEAYMANLSDPRLRANVRPATPDQVRAGVPAGACVYNLAWDAIVWLGAGPAAGLSSDASAAGGSGSAKTRDVADAIRSFRNKTRAEHAAASREASGARMSAPTHCHWTGSLEMVLS